MPDDGASMADAPCRSSGEETAADAQGGTKAAVQSKPMREYEIEQRKAESARVIERAGGHGEDDGTDQVFRPDDRPSAD
ncbi:MAG: hypothetical protein ACJ740_18140 [Gaiellales bacterium]